MSNCAWKVGHVYKTRGGRDVRILCTDRNSPEYPIVGLVDDLEIFTWRRNGDWRWKDRSTNHVNDLVPTVNPAYGIDFGKCYVNHFSINYNNWHQKRAGKAVLKLRWECRADGRATVYTNMELPKLSMASKLEGSAKEFVDRLKEVPGIETSLFDIITSRYELVIKKGELFTWDDVRPRVEAMLAEWFDADVQE